MLNNKKSLSNLKSIKLVCGKKGISEVVSYVLLIILSLSLAIFVFNWLRGFVPTMNEAKCPEGVSLIIKDKVYTPANKSLTLTIENRGRFNADGYYVRVNNATTPNFGIYVISKVGANVNVSQTKVTFFNTTNYTEGNQNYSLGQSLGLKLVEVQPFVYQKGHSGPVICEAVSRVNIP